MSEEVGEGVSNSQIIQRSKHTHQYHHRKSSDRGKFVPKSQNYKRKSIDVYLFELIKRRFFSSQNLKTTYFSSQTVLTSILFLYPLLINFIIMPPVVSGGINCFKCVSLNGDNPSCEDPFHNNYSSSILDLESPCMGGRKGRNGLFPATACIKLKGTYYDNGDTVVVRGCSLDSGSLTADTEIIRMSHCGGFELDDRYVKGCLQSCDDADGCNESSRPNVSSNPKILLIALLLQLTLSYFSTCHPHFLSTS